MQAVFRSVILYLALVAVIRCMGKRQLGQMEPSEFVVTMLLANLASIPMEEPQVSLLSGLLPILTVFGAEMLLSVLSLRSVWFRKLLCGKPVILIENGKIIQEHLKACRISLDELTELLRGKDVLELQSVQYAILETGGGLSVFPYPQEGEQYLPYTIIADGYVYEDNLRLCGRNRKWLQKELDKRGTTPENTWLLTLDGAGKLLWLPKEYKRRKS